MTTKNSVTPARLMKEFRGVVASMRAMEATLDLRLDYNREAFAAVMSAAGLLYDETIRRAAMCTEAQLAYAAWWDRDCCCPVRLREAVEDGDPVAIWIARHVATRPIDATKICENFEDQRQQQ